MSLQSQQPFESIESAYDFFRVLSEAVADAKQDIEAQIQGQQAESDSKSSRRLDALRVVNYKVEKLELHTNCCRRILNDLRSLRRLLFEERAASKAAVVAPKPAALPTEKVAATTLHVVTARVARVRGKKGAVAAA